MNNEQVWILQSQKGNDEAFANLVEAYQTPVYNLCYRMLGEPEVAEEAAQETFIRVYQNLLRYDPRRPFTTWLLSIAAHYCIDRLRRRRLVAYSLDEDSEMEVELPDQRAVDPETEAVRREESENLQRLLLLLSPVDRATLILRYWHDCSEVEIAESLSLTVSAAKSRLHRAKRELAKLWEEENPATLAERMPYESPAF